jgi:serine/threonine protein kinase
MAGRKDNPPYRPNDVIDGKYRVRKILGAGGMSVVYDAEDTTCERIVAVKVLRPSMARRHSYSAEQIRREAAVLVRLHDIAPAYFVDVLTAGVTGDKHRLPYCVMERLIGNTLRQFLEQTAGREIYINELAVIVIDLATALAYAHEAGVVHRDMKPDNAFYARTPEDTYSMKLMDFGIWVPVSDALKGIRTPGFTGSLPYAAPEQLNGMPATPATDVYALGLILFELLTGELPHDRANRRLEPHQLALNVHQEPVPNITAMRPDAPPRLVRTLVRCLSPRPNQRPTALELAKSVRDAKNEFERKLVGAEDAQIAITDVSGPPIAVLLERLDKRANDTLPDPPTGMSHATEPNPQPPSESHEATATSANGVRTFFMKSVHSVEQELEARAAAEAVQEEPRDVAAAQRLKITAPYRVAASTPGLGNSAGRPEIADVRRVLEDGGRRAKQVRIENKVYVDLDAARGSEPHAHAGAGRVDRQATPSRSRDLVPAVPNPTPIVHSTEVTEAPSRADRATRSRASGRFWIAAAAIALILCVVLARLQLAAIRGDTGSAALRNAEPDRGVVVSGTQATPLKAPTPRVSSTAPPASAASANVASGGSDVVTREGSRQAEPVTSTRTTTVAPAPAAPGVVARSAPRGVDFLDRVDQLDPAGQRGQEVQRGQPAKSSAPKKDGATGEFRTSF